MLILQTNPVTHLEPARMRDNCSTNEKEFDSRTIEEGRCKVFDLLGISSEPNEAQRSSMNLNEAQ